ncbi:MAG: bifunctional UDP-N-acetylglucosamine diphosphorylase/glucosamine-1-phosphate N-acetyltransferase GlmU [Chloroflexi bacterium]|nr:bifunctional UDP-N-acetylglucosamine diphosphorylase/glucosamine-1-phosphate N-acetyltransferase GlmU [Chloroflexota bacterium]
MRSRRPKVVHTVCGLPMIAHVTAAARQAGIEHTIVVVGAQGGLVRDSLGEGHQYATQPNPRGTADAVAAARSHVEGRATHLLVLNGDLPLVRPETLDAMMAAHRTSGSPMTILTCSERSVDLPGRVLRDADGVVQDVIEAADLPEGRADLAEINCGAYCFDAGWLWPSLGELRPGKRGELYLTSLVGLAYRQGTPAASAEVADATEALGVDTRVRLAQAEGAMRRRIRERWMLEGVTMVDPSSTYIDAAASIGRDTVLHPNTFVLGDSIVGEECEIGPGTVLTNARIGSRCRVLASMVEDSTLEPDVTVGPYSHLRGESYIESGAHLGNFVEIKKSRLGAGTRSHHFSYIGDATVGKNVNIGAGTVTCNFDGVDKHPTIIEEEAFIGCDSMLVAPLRVGARARTGAGAVVTKDVPPDTLVVGVPARPLVKGGEPTADGRQVRLGRPPVRRAAKGKG